MSPVRTLSNGGNELGYNGELRPTIALADV